MMKRIGLNVLACAAWLVVAGPHHGLAATAAGEILTNAVGMNYRSGPPIFEPYTLSYVATATVEVIPPPRLMLTKQLTADGTYREQFIVGAGALVTYRICARNDTVTAATNIMLTDLMPAGMSFWDAPVDWTGGNYYTGTAPTLSVVWGLAPPPADPVLPTPPGFQSGPIYLGWAINSIDSFKSVCVTFRATIQ